MALPAIIAGEVAAEAADAAIAEGLSPGTARFAEFLYRRMLEREREASECFDQWVTLVSSNLDQFFYDSSSRELTIEFHGARQYKYFNIDAKLAVGLCRASSPGKWWWANLEGAPAQRL